MDLVTPQTASDVLTGIFNSTLLNEANIL